jgi:hypothetical protein
MHSEVVACQTVSACKMIIKCVLHIMCRSMSLLCLLSHSIVALYVQEQCGKGFSGGLKVLCHLERSNQRARARDHGQLAMPTGFSVKPARSRDKRSTTGLDARSSF